MHLFLPCYAALQKKGNGMEILVFSDSHLSPLPMMRVLHAHKDTAMILFCGDGVSDISRVSYEFQGLPVRAVRGNCDFNAENAFPDEDVFTVGGVRIFLTHGHLYDVKHSLGRLLLAAKAKEASIAVFGHTHIPTERYETVGDKTIALFNPGSIGMKADGKYHYGVIEIRNGSFLLSHGTI